jgi:hypothetical protein
MFCLGRPGPRWAACSVCLTAVAVALPSSTRADAIAEAAFLADTLPPGNLDLNLSIGVTRGETPEDGGRAPLVTMPRVQLTLPLAERVGLTADVGLLITSATGGTSTDATAEVDTPSISLKVDLVPEAEGVTGWSVSADLYGSTHSLEETEAGFNMGAVRDLGFVTVRAAVGLASAAGRWDPHLHGGASLAAEPWHGWRFLGEAVGALSIDGGERWLAVGPAVKRSFGRAALMAAVVTGVAGHHDVTGLIQVTTPLN